ncbi:glucose-6-phosphate dehydrogenase [Microbacterium fluvii]|uniref:Glucose-6-phosphate dehydrogenase n=1 Tax=Microbacterium fluvii TaxID=415215 RepID=A0ABW2HGS9_9MICO|nr:glucose-6-phosphate dehydrogenase [Microbacterium fluvii]MCU4672293.1 glucose-6-phosphate dehydrogenase [Microbacterium fluvii]
MKIVAGADWRDGLPFEAPVLVSEVIPGEPTRCFTCGTDSALRERTELWAVKHRHPKQHAGFVRFYCAEHKPAPPARPQVTPDVRPASRAPRAARAERSSTPARRAAAAEERPKALCPNCFVEVPPSGVCGMCGERVD